MYKDMLCLSWLLEDDESSPSSSESL